MDDTLSSVQNNDNGKGVSKNESKSHAVQASYEERKSVKTHRDDSPDNKEAQLARKLMHTIK